jgi:hypothetical protein
MAALMTRSSAGLRFQSVDFHGLSQQSEAHNFNISSLFFDPNDERGATMLGA